MWWAWTGTAPIASRALLDADERARHDRFVFQRDRRRYLAAHALARLVISGYLDEDAAALRFVAHCNSCGGAHGKPRLAQPSADLELSLSRSGDRVAVAVARGVPVGVDVEQVSAVPGYEHLVEDVLSPAERRGLQELPSPERLAALLRYWVRKEAVLKATGDGLALSPTRITVSAPDVAARLLEWSVPSRLAAEVQLHDLAPADGVVGSLALLTEGPHRVVEREGSFLLEQLGRSEKFAVDMERGSS